MSGEVSMIRARFALRFRCGNCRLMMCRELVSPELEDAPADVEELLGSALLAMQVYPCESCDNPVSSLIGVRQLDPGEVLEGAVMADDASRRTQLGTMTALQRAAALSAARRRGLR